MFCIGDTLTSFESLNEDILGIVEFHEVGRALLAGLDVESLGIVEFHEVCRNFL